jgi:hypothetical protein
MNRRHWTQRSFALAGLIAAIVAGGSTALAQNSRDDRALSDLDERVAALAEEARRLEDIVAIHRIQRAYGYYIDKGFWSEAADLFAADATLEVGVDGVYRGRERIRQAIVRYGDGTDGTGPGLPFGQFNHHMQLQPVVTIADAGDMALARWRELVLLGEYEVSAHWGDAVMENVYIKENGVWKIDSLRLYTNFVAPYEGGWATLPPAAGDWQSEVAKAFPPDAPPTARYRPFPEIFVSPFHYEAQGEPLARALAPVEVAGDGTAAALETAANAVAARLAVLASERAIENLQGKYGYYVDKGLWDEAASLFARDGTYEFGQNGIYVGRDRVRAGLGLMGDEGLERGQLNNYPMLQPIISVAPDNRTAKARWRSDVQVSQDGKGRWGAGVYENEYVNDDGVWRIAKLHYYVAMWSDYDLGWVAGPLPMDGPSTTSPPDRPPSEVYASLPTAHFVPYHYTHPVREGRPILPITVPRGQAGAAGAVATALAALEIRNLLSGAKK